MSQSPAEISTERVLSAGRNSRDGLPRTILLVEDETFVRAVSCEVLRLAGFEVLEARTAVEAVSTFRLCGDHVHLLLTDVVLPGQNGRDLARDLRNIRPGLKIVFMSGYPENEVTKLGMPGQGVFYLSKPFSANSLMKKISEVWEDDGAKDEEK